MHHNHLGEKMFCKRGKISMFFLYYIRENTARKTSFSERLMPPELWTEIALRSDDVFFLLFSFFFRHRKKAGNHVSPLRLQIVTAETGGGGRNYRSFVWFANVFFDFLSFLDPTETFSSLRFGIFVKNSLRNEQLRIKKAVIKEINQLYCGSSLEGSKSFSS